VLSAANALNHIAKQLRTLQLRAKVELGVVGLEACYDSHLISSHACLLAGSCLPTKHTNLQVCSNQLRQAL